MIIRIAASTLTQVLVLIWGTKNFKSFLRISGRIFLQTIDWLPAEEMGTDRLCISDATWLCCWRVCCAPISSHNHFTVQLEIRLSFCWIGIRSFVSITGGSFPCHFYLKMAVCKTPIFIRLLIHPSIHSRSFPVCLLFY